MTGLINHARILIIEDNAPNYALMARILEHFGAHCIWKKSAREVAEYAEADGKLDLILMDLRLPFEDGYSALRKIRAIKEWKDTPVVVVTAYASEEEMSRSRAAGFDGFVGKPISPDRFPEQVVRMLSKKPVWEVG